MLETDTKPQTWLPLSLAAARLNVHPTTLRRWADNGDIPFLLTPGGHRRFAVSDIEEFASSQQTAGAGAGRANLGGEGDDTDTTRPGPTGAGRMVRRHDRSPPGETPAAGQTVDGADTAAYFQ